MPVFVEDPAHFSKSRLRSDLVAHNVELPPGKSKKEVYVQLYLKHLGTKNAADFSSDEEDQAQDGAAENPEKADVRDPSCMTDDELRASLLAHGVKAGPIVASTRLLYEKVSRTLHSDGHNRLNGADKGTLYSDSEEDEESGEEEENDRDEDAESGAEEDKEEMVEQLDQAQQESSQNGAFAHPQCFVPPSRMHVRPTRNREASLKWNSGNALKSSEWSRSHWSQIPAGISRASSVDQRSGLGSGVPTGSQSVIATSCSSSPSQSFSITQMVEEMESQRPPSTRANTRRELKVRSRSPGVDMPVVDKCNMTNESLYYTPRASPHKSGYKLPEETVKDTFKEMFSDTVTTPTGICATPRRPIKGAAGRPIQYAYPDTPVSPTTAERREVERRLVPVRVQILAFLFVVCVLYLICVCLCDDPFSPFVDLLDSLYQGLGSEEGLLLQMEAQDTQAAYAQE